MLHHLINVIKYLYQISTNSRFEQEVMLHHLINVIKNAKQKTKKQNKTKIKI